MGCEFIESWSNKSDLPITKDSNDNYQLWLKKDNHFQLTYCFVCGDKLGEHNNSNDDDWYIGKTPYCKCGLVTEWKKDTEISVEFKTIPAKRVFPDVPFEKIPFETVSYYVIFPKKDGEPILINLIDASKVPLGQSMGYCPGCGGSLADEKQDEFSKQLIEEEEKNANSSE